MLCDVRMAQILGRDSDFVNAVRIKSVKTGGDGYVVADFDVLKTLKGSRSMLSNIYYPKEFATAIWHPDSGPAQRLLEPGSERVSFLSKLLDRPSVESSCALMAPTQQTSNAAEEGIAADRSGMFGEDWSSQLAQSRRVLSQSETDPSPRFPLTFYYFYV